MNISLLRKIDKWIFGFLVLTLKIFPKRSKPPKEIKKILVIKLWAVGDAVLSLPMIYGLKKNYPKAKIEVFCHKNNSFVYEGHADKINYFPGISMIFKLRYYDFVFDTEPFLNVSAICSFWLGKFRIGFINQFRSSLYNRQVSFSRERHIVQNYLEMIRALGIRYDTDKLIKINTENKMLLKFKKKIGKGKFVGITPSISGSVKSRMWPLENMAKVIEYLTKKGYKVIIIDNKENQLKVNELISYLSNKEDILDYTGKTTWKESVCLISLCDIYISNDTGPLHLAAAQGVKAIGLFGPNLPALWGPYGKGNISLYKHVECSPCIRNDLGIFPECIYKGTDNYQICMKKIKVEEVIETIDKLIKK